MPYTNFTSFKKKNVAMVTKESPGGCFLDENLCDKGNMWQRTRRWKRRQRQKSADYVHEHKARNLSEETRVNRTPQGL